MNEHSSRNKALTRSSRNLRPSAQEAADAWRALVVAEREQVERLPDRPRPEDFYAPIAGQFRAEARRTNEPMLNHLLSLVEPGETWLDIGAGGGRYTLPLALHAARVFAVEPSAGMREVLSASARDERLENIEVIAERWPGETAVPLVDVSLICHVGYDIAEMGALLQQMEEHTRRLCVAVLFDPSPTSDFAPLWPAVHAEERVLLPGLAELLTLLFARGKRPEVTGFRLPPRTYPDRGALHAAMRRPLWVLEGTPQDALLSNAVQQMALEVGDGLALSRRERFLGVVTWRPQEG